MRVEGSAHSRSLCVMLALTLVGACYKLAEVTVFRDWVCTIVCAGRVHWSRFVWCGGSDSLSLVAALLMLLATQHSMPRGASGIHQRFLWGLSSPPGFPVSPVTATAALLLLLLLLLLYFVIRSLTGVVYCDTLTHWCCVL
jgi:hypothetical protein